MHFTHSYSHAYMSTYPFMHAYKLIYLLTYINNDNYFSTQQIYLTETIVKYKTGYD